MPYNGSGTYTRSHSWTTDQNNGVDIEATRMDTEDDGFAAGLSNAMTRDGQSPPTANIPMNNQRLTGLGDAAAATDGMNRRTGDARYIIQSATGLTGPVGIALTVSASEIDLQLATWRFKTVVGALTWTFINPPASGLTFGFYLELTNGAAGTQTWPASVKWTNNVAPTLSANIDILGFMTRDGGSTYSGAHVIRNRAA